MTKLGLPINLVMLSIDTYYVIQKMHTLFKEIMFVSLLHSLLVKN